ncbi:hypothetical protein ACFLS9_08365 [Bacteroidota bacterium]
MEKFKTVILISVLLPLTLLAQEFQLDIDYIKNSPDYYFGEGISDNWKEAEDFARAQLVESIAVTIQSSFQSIIMETTANINETVKSILNTYSIGTLKGYEKIPRMIDGKVNIFVYIEKTKVTKIYDERKKLLRSLYDNAEIYVSETSFGYALKLYYFAIILMNSIPEQNILYGDINLKTEIPRCIENIIMNTKFKLVKDTKISDKERLLIFDVTVFEKPAAHFEFSYWDGTKHQDVRARDGKGTARLFGSYVDLDIIKININYKYYECRSEDKDVYDLWDLVLKPDFNNSQQISLIPVEEEIPPPPIITNKEDFESNDQATILNIDEGNYKLNLHSSDMCTVIDKIGKETYSFLELISFNNKPKIKSSYDHDPYLSKKIIDILNHNNLTVLESEITAKLNKTYDGWELRKIKVLNEYPTLRKQTTEYIVLDFDSTGNLYDINFGIQDNIYNKIFEQSKYGLDGGDWANRQVILKFAEKYRTTFLTRDIHTLESIFADEAIIIVGRILEKRKIKDLHKIFQSSEFQPTYEQIRYTKDEYLKRQANIFASREDLFLGFSTLNIKGKNKQKGVYGLSLRQHYNSTGYSDEGYLFLLVDFNEDLPQIYVRSWQPQEWDEQSLIRLSNFNLNK